MRYSSHIEAIYIHTDDGIYFSKILLEDLMEQSNNLISDYRAKFGAPPKTNRADFEGLEDDGLLPDPSDYTDWEKMS